MNKETSLNDLGLQLLHNNYAWEATINQLAKCSQSDNHIYIPVLIDLCDKRNKIIETIKEK